MKKKTRLSKRNKFLVVLSETLRSHEKMIGREISYRMGKFKEKEIADLQGRIGECKTYIQEIVESQLKPVTTKDGRRKLEKFKEDPEYIIKYIYGSIPNYCKRKRREWDNLYQREFVSALDERTDDEWLSSNAKNSHNNQEWNFDSNLSEECSDRWDYKDENEDNYNGEWDSDDHLSDDNDDESNYQNDDDVESWGTIFTYEGNNEEKPNSDNSPSASMFDEVEKTEREHEQLIEKQKMQQKLLQQLLAQKGISSLKRRCLKDRFSGMSFPKMAMKYESEKKSWDKKGNKYRKRFYRAAADIGLDKENIDKFLKELKQSEKAIQRLNK